MAGLKEVRIRIASVNSTKQITSAMKMVSAASLRKAQGAIVKLRPYANKLNEILSGISTDKELASDISYFKNRPVRKALVIVITSNRGLCGAFNTSVIKAAIALVNEKYSGTNQNVQPELMCIGCKAYDFFSKRKYIVCENHSDLFENLSYARAESLAAHVMKLFNDHVYDEVMLVYNQFKNAATYLIQTEQYLPVVQLQTKPVAVPAVSYIFEPSADQILGDLIPRTLKIQLYKAILDSWTSEHGARMTAMHKATDNANELLKQLQLSYNKARQAAITNEIIEIVSGVNALHNQ